MSGHSSAHHNRLLALEQELLQVRQMAQQQSDLPIPDPSNNRLLLLAQELHQVRQRHQAIDRPPPIQSTHSVERSSAMTNDDFAVANQLLELEQSLINKKRQRRHRRVRTGEAANAFDFDRPITFGDDNAAALAREDQPISNQLAELERSLLEQSPRYQRQQSVAGAMSGGQVTAMAFDFDEAIQLEFSGNSFAAAVNYETSEQPYYQLAYEPEEAIAASWQDSGHSDAGAFQLSDDAAAFEVEAFEVEATPAESFGADDPTPIYPTYPTHTPSQRTTIEVESTPPRAAAFDWDEVEAFSEDAVSGRSADAEAFAADIQAILRGEKTYEPATQQSVAEPAAPTQSASPTQSEPDQPPVSQATSHDIFDQIAKNMAFANSFDLGTISMEQRFDEFDRLLDKEEQSTPKPPTSVEAVAYAVPEAESFSHAVELSAADLAADFASMGSEAMETHAIQMDRTRSASDPGPRSGLVERPRSDSAPSPLERPAQYEVRAIEFDALPGNKRNAPYEHGKARAKLKTHWPKLHLQYSAFFNLPAEPAESILAQNVFVVGWDHALVLKKRGGVYYADSVYVHGDSTDPARQIYQIIGGVASQVPSGEAESKAIAQGKHQCKNHKNVGCAWKKYPLAERLRDQKIDRVITWGVTSCSVACLWNEDAETIIISHMNASPPIPVLWLAAEEKVTNGKPFRIITSSHPGSSELNKLKQESLPFAAQSGSNARMVALPRGPLALSHLDDDAAFLTHPYVELNLTQLTTKGPLLEGVVGYNNDPEIPVEMPPFHTVLSRAHSDLSSGDPVKIVAAVERLLKGDYGNKKLFNDMVANIKLKDVNNYRSDFTRQHLNTIKQQTDAKPGTVKGLERAICILAELMTSKTPQNKVFQDAVLNAWNENQLKFSIPLSSAAYDQLLQSGQTI